jgi:hypothetical protein
MVLCVHLVMGEVIVHFVDICAIIDHCCLNFLLIIGWNIS